MKALSLLAASLLVASSISCGPATQGAESPPPSRLARILESGVLRVGLSGTQPPLNMVNKNGDLVGLDVDLIHALGDAMKVEIRTSTYPFSELLSALEDGRVDLVISGMTITPKRNARVSFAGPYFVSGKSLVTKSDELADAQHPSELNSAGRKYAALAGSTSEEFVKESLPNAELIATADYDTGVRLVLDDKVDALVADFPFCVLSTMRHPAAELSTLITPLTIEPLGIALPADDPLFVNLVENYLSTLESTGLLSQFKAKWFSEGSWIEELP